MDASRAAEPDNGTASLAHVLIVGSGLWATSLAVALRQWTVLRTIGVVRALEPISAPALRRVSVILVVGCHSDESVRDTLRAARRLRPSAGCVVISCDGDSAVPALRGAGALTVLPPDAALDELARAVYAAHLGRGRQPRPERPSTDAAPERGETAEGVHEVLTPRQRDVLQGLARGMRHADIAEQLGIAPETARTHIRDLLERLGASSRLEAVVVGMRLGLVDPPR